MTYDFLFMKNYANVPVKSNKQSKKLLKKSFLVDVLKVTDENRRIRIRIRIHLSDVWIRGSGSALKFHGSATLRRTGNTF
jgi:hypothetical protein